MPLLEKKGLSGLILSVSLDAFVKQSHFKFDTQQDSCTDSCNPDLWVPAEREVIAAASVHVTTGGGQGNPPHVGSCFMKGYLINSLRFAHLGSRVRDLFFFTNLSSVVYHLNTPPPLWE